MNEEEPKIEIKDNAQFVWIVPECCKTGDDNCPHVSIKEKDKQKQNIGL